MAFYTFQIVAGSKTGAVHALITQAFGFAKALSSLIILKNFPRLKELELMRYSPNYPSLDCFSCMVN